ncbi:hypothetical protein OPQ81_008065 [Rhizoctonia solani]|nr:hypothetical protein OPQ81_008065 [Rhizoctonia solani]
MMKRTDSVKRWSVTTPGLNRHPTGDRSSYDNKSGATSPGRETTSRPVSRSKESTSRPTSRPASRPTSSHAKDAPSFFPATDTTAPSKESVAASPKPELAVPEPEPEQTIPTSPSRTMDPRRWSPTKSSWLDAALKQPESPKPKPAAMSNQPAWMVELNKAKAAKAKNGSVDLDRAGSSAVKKHEVKTGGLVRPAPLGTTVKQPSLSGITSPSIGIDKPTTPGLRSAGFSKSPAVIGGVLSPDMSSARRSRRRLRRRTSERTYAREEQRWGNADKSDSTNELASVFGKLRKTTTQNYVAPDELKDNILRGKSGLNVTGGPRPYTKKDDFKDAILARKADFKQAKEEGRGVATNVKAPQEQVIPEGIARRNTISRSKSISHSRGNSVVSSIAPEEPARAVEPSKAAEPPLPPSRAVNEDAPALKAKQTEPVSLPGLSKEKSIPGKLPGKIGGNALANRFNPALAGLLARGPPGMGGAANDASGTSSAKGTSDAGNEPGQGPQLTHMTKNRARGPRRKAPASASKSPAPDATDPVAADPVSNAEAAAVKGVGEKAAPPLVSPAAAPPAGSPAVQQQPDPAPVVPPKPSVQIPPEISQRATSRHAGYRQAAHQRRDLPRRLLEEETRRTTTCVFWVEDRVVAAIAAKSQPVEEKKAEEPPSRSPSPRKLDARRMSRFLDESNLPSPKNEPEPAKPISPVRKSFGGPPSPVKVSSVEKVDSQPAIGEKPAPPPKPDLEPLSLPVTSPTKDVLAKSVPIESVAAASPSPLTSPTRSPSKSGSDVSAMLKDFFGTERSRGKYRADAGEILMNRPKGGSTVQTQKAQLYQITEQGKRVPVPSHYERVLFEREMYLCSHTFTNAARKKVQEVYFWAGDEVPASVVEDAQVFVNREARSLGGTLIKLSQGKESAEFIQALGGIVIIRRGSSNKYDSLAPNMLCGRSYLGQIVFDEVDFAPLTLCSGFPYIITQSGKCYLWKGKGSGIDELSCARLIGMDSALMGELVEVEEGQGARTVLGPVRRQEENELCRPLEAEAELRQINEINPFSQSDLSSNKVYVLDAFFEMYIIVGKNAQSEYASFHNALDFAQEYAILAAGMEGPPVCAGLDGSPRGYPAGHEELLPQVAGRHESHPDGGGEQYLKR